MRSPSHLHSRFRLGAAPRLARAQLVQLAAFVTIGMGAAFVYYALSQLVVRSYGALPEWVASGALYGAMIVPVYLLHRRFSFVATASHRRALPLYAGLQLGLVGLGTLFSYLAYRVLGMPTQWAALIVVVLTSGVSFVVSRAVVFRAPPT